jgi:1-acyl-sn-glycerol-3-phosphate acyltransferase
VVRPFLTFLYQTYWRVQTTGLDHVPDGGRILLIGNHHGRSPWEGAMVSTAIANEHPSGRIVRSLYAAWFSTLPFLSMLFVKLGHAVGTVENARRLLEADELVAVYPESYRRSGLITRRLLSDAAAWPDFIKLALSTQTPIIPIAIVGAEETYRALGQATIFSRLTGRPHPVLSPQSPAFGPLGFMPLPTGWSIDFGQPVPMEPHGSEAADDEVLVSQLTGQIQDTIEAMLAGRGAERRFGLFRR